MSTSPKSLVVALALVSGALAPTAALAAADSLGASGPITTFKYIGDSSSYSGNMRLVLVIGGQAYYNGASGFCSAYTEFTTEEIALLQQVFVHGIDVTPRYKTGTYSKRCIVGWDNT